jgi:hypothetical protein
VTPEIGVEVSGAKRKTHISRFALIRGFLRFSKLDSVDSLR